MPKDSSNGVQEANAFLEHVQSTYPETADHWQALESEGDFVDIIKDEDYASDRAAGFSFGIVFSSGSPEFEYKVLQASFKYSSSIFQPEVLVAPPLLLQET